MAYYKWKDPQHNDTFPYTCPYCNRDVAGNKKFIVAYEDSHPPYSSRDVFYILQCPSCEKPTIFDCRNRSHYPFIKELREVQKVPNTIAKAYDEIRRSLGAGCYTSTVVYARTLIAHIAVDKGAKENCSFKEYVDYLANEGYIPPNSKGWVDKIRVMGNTAIHDLEQWDKENAMMIGRFVMYLLIFIYELPNQI